MYGHRSLSCHPGSSEAGVPIHMWPAAREGLQASLLFVWKNRTDVAQWEEITFLKVIWKDDF